MTLKDIIYPILNSFKINASSGGLIFAGKIRVYLGYFILLIIIFIPKWQSKSIDNKHLNESKLSTVWKNPLFRSLVPMGFFSYGGLFAIQTLWAGPWMIRVSGYTPEESAQGLFIIYFCMLISFLVWGIFCSKIFKKCKWCY